MPKLPDIDITNQTHYDTLVAAFPGTTPQEKAENYRSMVTDMLIDYVFQLKKAEAIEAIRASLPAKSGKGLWPDMPL